MINKTLINRIQLIQSTVIDMNSITSIGYSISSGVFFDDGRLLYVSGAPRAAAMKGQVNSLLFQFFTN